MCINIFSTSAPLCIYMHRLKWRLIAQQSVRLVDPMSMLLSQIRSQLRSQLPSSSCMFEATGMALASFRDLCELPFEHAPAHSPAALPTRQSIGGVDLAAHGDRAHPSPAR